jgi:hypothetical protein
MSSKRIDLRLISLVFLGDDSSRKFCSSRPFLLCVFLVYFFAVRGLIGLCLLGVSRSLIPYETGIYDGENAKGSYQ